jgi:hypothetical protein
MPLSHGKRGMLVVDAVPAADILAVWEAAYELVPVPGRQPVVVSSDLSDPWTRPDAEPAPSPDRLAALDETARTLDPWPSRMLSDEGERVLDLFPDDPLDGDWDEAEMVASGYSGVGLSEGELREVPSPITDGRLERLVFDRIRSDPARAARVRAQGRHDIDSSRWIVFGDPSLLLLPTSRPWLAAEWVHLFETGTDELAAALWQWHQRWDARLFAAWGTILQFVVHRPPASPEEAWELAAQFKALGPDMNLARWEAAIVLPTIDTWFVHCRP